MISSVAGRCFLERPCAGAELTARKAVMRDIPTDPGADQRLCGARHHAAAHRIRNVGSHPGFHGGGARRHVSGLRGAAFLQSRRWAKSGRWRCGSKTHGAGRRLVEALLAEAQIYELGAVFAFTYVVEFFSKVGFHVVERGVLPLKAWKDCLRCPKFHACDEIGDAANPASRALVRRFTTAVLGDRSRFIHPVADAAAGIVGIPAKWGTSSLPAKERRLFRHCSDL